MTNVKNAAEEQQASGDQAPKTAPVPPTAKGASQTNGLAIAALVTGIIALMSGLIPFVGLVLGIAAIVMGIVSMKKAVNKGMSIAGIVTGAIGAVTSAVVGFLFIASLALWGGVAIEAGKAANEIGKAAESYNQEQQALIDSKKDFNKGDTAVFGNFEVKVNSVQRNYVPEDSYYAAGEGMEFILVNVSVKNVGQESKSFTAYDLSMNDNGVSYKSNYMSVSPEFKGGDISKGASASGNIVYEINKGSTNLKLQHEEIVYDLKSTKVRTLTYTLKI